MSERDAPGRLWRQFVELPGDLLDRRLCLALRVRKAGGDGIAFLGDGGQERFQLLVPGAGGDLLSPGEEAGGVLAGDAIIPRVHIHPGECDQVTQFGNLRFVLQSSHLLLSAIQILAETHGSAVLRDPSSEESNQEGNGYEDEFGSGH